MPTDRPLDKFTRNTSLQRDIQKHPALAKRLKEKYPDRFARLAGPNYVEAMKGGAK